MRKAAVKDAGDVAATMAVVARFAGRPLAIAASAESWSSEWPASGPWEP